MQPKKFQRKIEDFVCEHCGQKVRGSGYTDHCPSCLWSKHVDINPGDRQAGCEGPMDPISAEIEGGQYIIYYKCELCRFKHHVKAAEGDDFEEVLKITG